jgi:hypothetical protein
MRLANHVGLRLSGQEASAPNEERFVNMIKGVSASATFCLNRQPVSWSNSHKNEDPLRMVLFSVIQYGIYYKCHYIGINSHVLARHDCHVHIGSSRSLRDVPARARRLIRSILASRRAPPSPGPDTPCRSIWDGTVPVAPTYPAAPGVGALVELKTSTRPASHPRAGYPTRD